MTINRLGQGQTCTVHVRFTLDEISFEFYSYQLPCATHVRDGRTDRLRPLP